MRHISFLTAFLICSFRLVAQTTEALVQKNLDDLTIVIPSAKDEAGIGKNTGTPAGTPLKLPPGVKLVQRPHKAFDPDPKYLYGNANTFYADVNIVIDKDSVKTGAPVLITFEPGLIMLNMAPSRIQNGMLMDRVRINAPPTGTGPGGLRDTLTIYIGLVCLNESFGLPWEENPQGPDDVKEYPISKGMYAASTITTHKGLLMLGELLAQYPKLRLTKHYNPQLMFEEGYQQPPWMKIYSTIQAMVWKVTDGPGITKGELEKFKEELKPYK